jgi:rhodanese-related sulfurtransferase
MAQESATTSAHLVAEAKSRTENLTPDEVAGEIAEGGAVLIDLREPSERSQDGAIPGAIHAPRGMLEFYADPTSSYHLPEFDPNRRTILHCSAGGRSALAADTLRQLGYSNVAHLDGGLNAWKETGHAVEEADTP